MLCIHKYNHPPDKTDHSFCSVWMRTFMYTYTDLDKESA